LRKAAELGYAPAQSDMGLACYHGQGVPQDPGAAVTWFRKAAQQADPLGQYGLGICYMEGVGVRQEYKEAEVWIRKAAEQGYVRAQYALARLYNFGLGVTRDYAESASWYRKAAEQGYAVAQVDLGVAYMEGEGVPKSEEEGIKWFERASEQGDALGTYYAALFYWKKGHPQAMEKFELAATQGAPFGAFTLGEIYSRSLKSEGQTDKLKACVWFRIAEELDKQGDWERQRPDDTRKLRAELPKRLSQLRAELNSTQFADCQRQASEWVKTHVQQPPQ
jgi:TPR repeat protein